MLAIKLTLARSVLSRPRPDGGRATRSDNAKFTNIWVTGNAAGTEMVFPRVAGIYTSTPQTYCDNAYQTDLAKRDLVILSFWKGWTGPSGKTMHKCVGEIRSKHPGMLIGAYTNVMEAPEDLATAGSAADDIYNKIVSEFGPGGRTNPAPHNDWFARDFNGDQASEYANQAMTNVTRLVTRDMDGYTYPQWYARRQNGVLFVCPPPEASFWFGSS